MNRRSNLRASDADREQVTERLRRAAAEGRLLASELEERIAQALRARTYGELDAIVADLPQVHLAPAPRSDLGRWMKPVLALVVAIPLAIAAVAAVAAAAMIVLSGLAATWFVWVLLAWFVFGRRARHHHRPRPPRGAWSYGRYGGPPRRPRTYWP